MTPTKEQLDSVSMETNLLLILAGAQSKNEHQGNGTREQVELEQVIRNQREEVEIPSQEFGWFDIFCLNDCQETSPRPQTVTEFASQLLGQGWVAEGPNKATCRACQNNEPAESDYAYQYRVSSQGRLD